ncbi:hypothetical protein M427DRAFT_35111 [Gonapodya prolifera JEL478]|uniref:RRM domain-containing protein n=1 Tax=Gonapodya prolifera (strain JEL478) TaxID=1344416 RepID=A0A139A5J3_GONPJ|nr:hypothetical protein M427DRAFT_35111 [Gonapodya prolifera JEL478]|eukprot:KXS12046.1 hypothetical protein M427DRAFT_35111 [Gonapodya prolifera JEL478]
MEAQAIIAVSVASSAQFPSPPASLRSSGDSSVPSATTSPESAASEGHSAGNESSPRTEPEGDSPCQAAFSRTQPHDEAPPTPLVAREAGPRKDPNANVSQTPVPKVARQLHTPVTPDLTPIASKSTRLDFERVLRALESPSTDVNRTTELTNEDIRGLARGEMSELRPKPRVLALTLEDNDEDNTRFVRQERAHVQASLGVSDKGKAKVLGIDLNVFVGDKPTNEKTTHSKAGHGEDADSSFPEHAGQSPDPQSRAPAGGFIPSVSQIAPPLTHLDSPSSNTFHTPQRPQTPIGSKARQSTYGPDVNESQATTHLRRAALLEQLTIKAGPYRVFVANVPKNVGEARLRDFFSQILPVCTIYVGRDGPEHLGWAVAGFGTAGEASTAVSTFDGSDLDGMRVRVSLATLKNPSTETGNNAPVDRPRRPPRMTGAEAREKIEYGANVYLKNLADVVDEKYLHTLLSPFGTVVSIRVQRDETGCSKHYGFCAFDNSASALECIAAIDGLRLEGRIVRASVAHKSPRKGKWKPVPGALPPKPGTGLMRAPLAEAKGGRSNSSSGDAMGGPRLSRATHLGPRGVEQVKENIPPEAKILVARSALISGGTSSLQEVLHGESTKVDRGYHEDQQRSEAGQVEEEAIVEIGGLRIYRALESVWRPRQT